MDAPRTTTATRLELYARTARALNRFFGEWTAAFCCRCLEVTARAYPEDPGADVEVLDGQFPGCCQAGVADTLKLPGRGEESHLPEGLAEELKAARAALGASACAGPLDYTLRELRTGRVVRGRGCRHLGADGCSLGELKRPLCLTYVCEGICAAVDGALRSVPFGGGGDSNLFDATDTLFAVATQPRQIAEARVEALEEHLWEISDCLRTVGVTSGQELLERWLATATADSFRGEP